MVEPLKSLRKLKTKLKNPLITIIIIGIIDPVYNKIAKIKKNIPIETLNIKITITTLAIPSNLITPNVVTVIYKAIITETIINNVITVIYRIIIIITVIITVIITAIINKGAIYPIRIGIIT